MGLFDRAHHVTTDSISGAKSGYCWRCLTCGRLGHFTQSLVKARAAAKEHAKPQPRRR